jgi:tripartite-type tricarboxylate transporter receptor subunit TctC
MRSNSSHHPSHRVAGRGAVLLKCVAVVASLLLPCAAQGAQTSNYPQKPVRVIVPVTTGGGSDVLARLFSQHLSERLNQPFIVDNRAGAGGVIGSELVARALPDGYTLMVAYAASHGINPAIKKLPYDAIKDFSPISLLATAPNVLVVHPSIPAKTVKELIEYIRARQGSVNYASAGVGSAPHLAAELFKHTASVQMNHIPYKGASPAVTDVVGGQVPLTFASMPATLPHVRAGRLRALAVTSAKRASAAPDLPTVSESGLPGFEVIQWYSFLAPARTPATIIEMLNSEILRIIKVPDVREKLATQGIEPGGSSPAEVRQFMSAEIAKWTKLIRETGLKLE